LQGRLQVRKKYVPYIEIFRIYFSQILRYFWKIKIIKITHINLAASPNRTNFTIIKDNQ
jgi:hypothetical protein